MFEVPQAKRVRREDLQASDDEAWSEEDQEVDAELRARLNAQIARSLGLDANFSQDAGDKAPHDGPSAAQAQLADAAEGDAGDEEFAFRLFSTAKPAQKVVLEEDLEPQGEGAFVAGRPLSYYLVQGLSREQRQEFSFAAVTGDEVLARSKARFWVTEMPWRVTRIAVTKKAKPGDTSAREDGKRRRPGKKQRISLRKKSKAREEQAKTTAQKLAEKEEHIKEKKKRMNRLKKLRKRAKNKEAKAAAGGDGGDSGDESGNSD